MPQPQEDANGSRRLRDIFITVAFFLSLFVVNWLGVFLGRKLLLQVVPTGQLGVYVGLVTFPVLGVARGVFHFLCGYWLGRLLRRINPWHVITGVAVLVALLFVVITPWTQLSEVAALAGTTPIIMLVQDLVGPVCLLLFLSFGVWYQRRKAHTQRAPAL